MKQTTIFISAFYNIKCKSYKMMYEVFNFYKICVAYFGPY